MFTKEDNQVLDRILNARKTCRAFAENVPTDDEIKEVIQAGCIAPYASIDAKAVTPFRHFFVIKKDNPKMEQIDAFIRQQSQVDLDARLACVLGYAKDNNAPQHPRATTQIHWL